MIIDISAMYTKVDHNNYQVLVTQTFTDAEFWLEFSEEGPVNAILGPVNAIITRCS